MTPREFKLLAVFSLGFVLLLYSLLWLTTPGMSADKGEECPYDEWPTIPVH